MEVGMAISPGDSGFRTMRIAAEPYNIESHASIQGTFSKVKFSKK